MLESCKDLGRKGHARSDIRCQSRSEPSAGPFGDYLETHIRYGAEYRKRLTPSESVSVSKVDDIDEVMSQEQGVISLSEKNGEECWLGSKLVTLNGDRNPIHRDETITMA